MKIEIDGEKLMALIGIVLVLIGWVIVTILTWHLGSVCFWLWIAFWSFMAGTSAVAASGLFE